MTSLVVENSIVPAKTQGFHAENKMNIMALSKTKMKTNIN